MEETFEERKERENQRQYQKWLSCGFVGEMCLNDCGWCENGVSFSEQAKKIILFDKYPFSANIEYLQLPNKKWIAGSRLICPLHGYGYGISVWSKQFDTENEAVTNEINRIENSLTDKDRKPFVLNAIQTCRNKYKKEMFETAFEPTAQFEQVTLF